MNYLEKMLNSDEGVVSLVSTVEAIIGDARVFDSEDHIIAKYIVGYIKHLYETIHQEASESNKQLRTLLGLINTEDSKEIF